MLYFLTDNQWSNLRDESGSTGNLNVIETYNLQTAKPMVKKYVDRMKKAAALSTAAGHIDDYRLQDEATVLKLEKKYLKPFFGGDFSNECNGLYLVFCVYEEKDELDNITRMHNSAILFPYKTEGGKDIVMDVDGDMLLEGTEQWPPVVDTSVGDVGSRSITVTSILKDLGL